MLLSSISSSNVETLGLDILQNSDYLDLLISGLYEMMFVPNLDDKTKHSTSLMEGFESVLIIWLFISLQC